MRVKLNSWRDGHNPGEVIDLDERDAGGLIAHGGAFPVDDLDEALDAAEAERPKAARVVKGTATLESASGADSA